MADQKISELNSITGANVDDANDELAIVDANASETKRITRAELFKGIDGDVGIGTSSPNTVFHVSAGSAFFQLEDSNTANTGRSITQIANDSGDFRLQTYTGAGSFVANDYLINRNDSGANTHAWRIGNSEVMRIDSSGNVLIGTTTGNYALAVKDSGVDLALINQNDTVWTIGQSVVLDEFTIRDATAGQNRLHIDSSGNVGIGTTSPTGKLEVNGNLDITSAIRHVGDTDTSIRFPAADTVTVETAGVERLRISSTGDLIYDTDALVVDAANDRVGINTATPATTLDVTGSIYASSVIRNTGGGSAATPSIQPGNDADTGMFWPGTNTIGFSTAGSERMRIDSSGNVGIGTTSPGSKLSVVGLPTSSSGLSAGDIWNDSGTLKIVT